MESRILNIEGNRSLMFPDFYSSNECSQIEIKCLILVMECCSLRPTLTLSPLPHPLFSTGAAELLIPGAAEPPVPGAAEPPVESPNRQRQQGPPRPGKGPWQRALPQSRVRTGVAMIVSVTVLYGIPCVALIRKAALVPLVLPYCRQLDN